jgi:hypothetical protein
MKHHINPTHGGQQRGSFPQVTDDQLNASGSEALGAPLIAHQGAHHMPASDQLVRQVTAGEAGRPGD